jgi:hypothetical protein
LLQLRTQTKAPREKPDSVAVSKMELDNCIAHNYSTQSLNSTELSKRKLKEVLSKVRDFLLIFYF